MAAYVKRLRRLPERGQISGVCAGLADYFELDVTLVRLIFVVLAIITGGGMIIAYIVMAIVMPTDKSVAAGTTTNLGESAKTLGAELRAPGRADRMRNYLGAGLILLVLWLLLGQLFPGWVALRWAYVWPAVIIIIGVVIATRRKE